ncbi:MAG: DUF4445 domain-containing protein [Anaerolineaceae bacterium]|nr:DUF4445 domain-containing protein [Anaerolineaceae bacterium]
MNQDKKAQISFQPNGKRVFAPVGKNILEIARDSGIAITSDCGGAGSCGQCQVIILSGEVSVPTTKEKEIIPEADLKSGRRLACKTQVLSDLKVKIPRDSLINGQRLQTDGEQGQQPLEVDPIVEIIRLEIQPPHIEDLRSDFSRLAEALNKPGLQASPEVLRTLSCDLRKHNWQISACIRENELVCVTESNIHPAGFAVDLGTTKIAAYLLDLQNGNTLASKGIPNPLIGYGDDVISRLNFACREPGGRDILAKILQNALNDLLGELAAEAHISREQVLDACIVGNTAMTHLLLNLPVEQLLKAPYVAAVSDALDYRASEVGLIMAAGAFVHVPGCIGGYVGADHVAMILGSEIDNSEKITLGVDIGTNTEIVLCIPENNFMASVSCASGPAFEGAHVSEGMRAASGAIEHVSISNNAIQCTTIDHEAPIGLCGSGIIDVIAEMYKSDLINQRGRVQDGKNIVGKKNEKSLLLVPAEDSGTGRDILVQQKDINQIQLAKGAIRAGLELLLIETNTSPETVQEVIIAGAFGSYLSVDNAITMGLFPDLPNAVYKQVGNAAVMGARKILLSKSARQQAIQIQQKTKYLELTTSPKFRRTFALGMLFPDKKKE